MVRCSLRRLVSISSMAMTWRTEAQLHQALAELAEIEGLSKPEIIRRAMLDAVTGSTTGAALPSARSACVRAGLTPWVGRA